MLTLQWAQRTEITLSPFQILRTSSVFFLEVSKRGEVRSLGKIIRPAVCLGNGSLSWRVLFSGPCLPLFSITSFSAFNYQGLPMSRIIEIKGLIMVIYLLPIYTTYHS
jgi:hypothetical protein